MKRWVLIGTFGLLLWGCGRFDAQRTAGMYSDSRVAHMEVLADFVHHRSAAERFLIDRYPRESREHRVRLAFYLGVVGGEETIDFVCRRLLARPDMEAKDVNDLLGILLYCTFDYDLGRTLLDPTDMEFGFQHPRVVLVAATTRTFLLNTLATVEQRLLRSLQVGVGPEMDGGIAQRMAWIRMNVAALPVYR